MADKEQMEYTLRFETDFAEKDIVFYDVRREPFSVFGLYDYKGEDAFIRIPDSVARATSDGVLRNSKHSSGGRIRFSTNSPYIVIKAELSCVVKHDHMPILGSTGMDLYIDSEADSIFYQSIRPGVNVTEGYTSIVRFDSAKMRKITINMPLYSGLKNVYIGISESASLGSGKKYVNDKPIVFYGSSITQGGCASRPGLCYQNIISRRRNLDFLNLGFSGSARGEETIANYMASLDMCAFVCDYDHNSSIAELQKNHSRLYDIIREKHPNLPYIMITRPDLIHKYDDAYVRRGIVLDSYRRARAMGDEHVYFIDGEGFFMGPDADSCTVDGVHPNDIGFLKMADSIERGLLRALSEAE
jgi:hypothetical protein